MIKYNKESQDGRIVTTLDQKNEIRKKYSAGAKMKLIAEEYNISESSVFFIIYPDKLKVYKERIKTTWRDEYDKEKHRLKIARYRAKKRALGFVTSKKPD